MIFMLLDLPISDEETRERLAKAKELLIDEVTGQVPPMIDPHELRHLKEQHEE